MIQYLIAALINFIFTALALRKKDSRSSLATGICTLCMGLWALELYFLSTIENLSVLYPLFYITRFGLFFIPFSFALFAYLFLSKQSKLYVYAVLLPGLLSTISLCFANVIFFPSTLKLTSGGYLPELDITYHWFLVNFLYLVVAAIVFCILSHPSVPFRERQKIRWLLATLAILLVTIIVTTIFFTKENYLSAMAGAIANIFFAITFFSTSNNERLMNLKLAVSEGAPRLIAISLYIGVFFALSHFSGGITASIGSTVIILLFTILVTQSYQYLIENIKPIIRKLVSKHSYDYKPIKALAQTSLEECTDSHQLSHILNNIFLHSIKVKNYRVFLLPNEAANSLITYTPNNSVAKIDPQSPVILHCKKDTNIFLIDEVPIKVAKEMELLDCQVATPIIHKGSLIGLISCGRPKLAEHFRNEDLYLIQWIGQEIGKSLERISRFKVTQDELAEARKTISLVSIMNQYHHDIKTPFAIIDGVVSTDIYDQEKQREIVLEQVEKGTRLIATMASILRGKRDRKIIKTPLECLIKDCLFVFEKRFHSISFDVSEIPPIDADAIDLKIMFVNVIKNSAESAKQNSELKLHIKIWSNNNYNYVSIKDTGLGMSHSQLNSIWNVSASEKEKGSGVGLQAIKRIADEHRIEISVESTPNKGTEFIFRFPPQLDI